ncbi:MAG: hypothetical protein MZV70_55855 [Desulfobacterales bacterium]|nr:hypothetical protein [Desulfobacterales bacterium]
MGFSARAGRQRQHPDRLDPRVRGLRPPHHLRRHPHDRQPHRPGHSGPQARAGDPHLRRAAALHAGRPADPGEGGGAGRVHHGGRPRGRRHRAFSHHRRAHRRSDRHGPDAVPAGRLPPGAVSGRVRHERSENQEPPPRDSGDARGERQAGYGLLRRNAFRRPVSPKASGRSAMPLET